MSIVLQYLQVTSVYFGLRIDLCFMLLILIKWFVGIMLMILPALLSDVTLLVILILIKKVLPLRVTGFCELHKDCFQVGS